MVNQDLLYFLQSIHFDFDVKNNSIYLYYFMEVDDIQEAATATLMRMEMLELKLKI